MVVVRGIWQARSGHLSPTSSDQPLEPPILPFIHPTPILQLHICQIKKTHHPQPPTSSNHVFSRSSSSWLRAWPVVVAMPAVESWDNDIDLQGDLFAPSVSAARTALSSRVSTRSESNIGEEDWQVLISPHDNTSTTNAITSANQVGIPIPKNVPSSALLGGTIKRLGKTKSRQDVSDDWGDDFDMPDAGMAGLKLRQPAVQDAPKTPAVIDEEFDSEWAEGSLGIRFAGTRRDTRGRSSSVSAMSPSMGSCMTVESEDDDLGGLVLPSEPLDFSSILKKRKATEYDAPSLAPPPPQSATQHRPSTGLRPSISQEDDDMMTGLELGGGELLDAKKRKINRNVKVKQAPNSGRTIRTSASLTFTDKMSLPVSSRIPRPTPPPKPSHKLDTVPESHSHIPSVTSRNITRMTRLPPTTTTAQLLRSKRSAPVLGSRQSINSARPPVPFLPAGVPPTQSQHVTAKSMHQRQSSDSYDRPASPSTRSFSRPGSAAHQTHDNTPSRTGYRRDVVPASLLRQAANQRTLQVTKRRNFGDGSELDRFDDLPTSTVKESKFTKQPSARPQPRTLRTTQSRRNLAGPSEHPITPVPPSSSSVTSTVPTTPLAPPTPKSYFPNDNTPRFARDTAASRNAREQRLANPRTRGSGPVEAVAINWKAQVAARSPLTSPSAQRIRKKGEGKQPFLIKHIGPTSKKGNSIDPHILDKMLTQCVEEKGMTYNPTLQRWEGNEHALTKFENPSTSTLPLHPTHKDNHSHHHHTSSIPNVFALAPRDHNLPMPPPRHGSPPRPALISQINNTRGVVVERGMVFDPQQMKWLKLDSRSMALTKNDPHLMAAAGSFGPGSISVEEEEDPFADIEELVDEKTAKVVPGAGGIKDAGKENEDWIVGEEFDLGPAFVRRQRTEENEWRRKVEKWMVGRETVSDDWRWEIRRVAEEYHGAMR